MSNAVDIFRKVFLANGYREESQAEIFPCPDRTTLFTCATISVLKEYVLTEKSEKAFVIQPCLRTQNLKQTLDKDFNPEYLSSFLMFGMLCPIEKFDPICVFEFFERFPSLKGRILVRSSKTIIENGLALVEAAYPVEYEGRHPSYYVWHYGENSLLGRGLTFALKQANGEYMDVGNLVIVSKNGRPVAVEFGFGQETFMARLQGIQTPYAASLKYLRLGLGMSAMEKRLGDTLIAANEMFKCGVRPGRGKASSVLRKALRDVCFLAAREFGESAFSMVQILAQRISADSPWLGSAEQTFRDVAASISMFTHEVKHMSRHAAGQHLANKIHAYRLRYGIPDQF